MAETSVSHVSLTVSTVEVFIQSMKFIHDNDLWDDAQAYLEEKGKTEMFIDFDVFNLFREMLKADVRVDTKDKAYIDIIRHRR